MSERIQVHCRLARESDTADVIELTKTIWDGHDYVPQAWPHWLADAEGALIVAEYQGRVIGLGKLSRLAEGDWWMQGLRVHPKYEGHGVASQLNDAMLEIWQKMGGGVVRLATASFRLPVHHICEKTSFTKVGEHTSFIASPTIPERSDFIHAEGTPLRLLVAEEIPEALAFALESPALAFSSGLMDMGWEWAPVRSAYLGRAVERQDAWWWQGRQALVVLHDDEDEGEPPGLVVEFMGGLVENVPPCLLDIRRLAGARGLERVSWMAALKPDVVETLRAAGFERDWEDTLFIYAKEMV